MLFLLLLVIIAAVVIFFLVKDDSGDGDVTPSPTLSMQLYDWSGAG